MENKYDTLNVLMIPTDYCNLKCVYCFNKRKTNVHKEVMDDKILEKSFNIIFNDYKKVNFIWHGGEPLTLGLDFFEKVVRLEKKYGKNVVIENKIQSNLTLLTTEICDYLQKNSFTIGGSYDDSANDYTRFASSKILKGIEIMRESNMSVSLISVITNLNIDTLIEDYEWHKQNKIPYTVNVYEVEKKNRLGDKLAVPVDKYIRKFKEFFDYWFCDIECNIDIRYFDIFVRYFILHQKYLCAYTSCLGKWVSILPNGQIYQCNRYFPEEYSYGNVMDYEHITQAFESDGFKRLLTGAIKRREKCYKCEAYDLCVGGCNNNAIIDNEIDDNGGYNCQILIPMYLYIKEKISPLLDVDIDDIKDSYNPYIIKLLSERKARKEGKSYE